MKTPLVDRETERAALGTIFLQPKYAPDTFAELTAEDFGVPFHRTIYSAAVEVFLAGEAVDSVSVIERLREQGKLKDGYVSLLAEITDHSFIPSGSHRKTVKRLSKSRSLQNQLKQGIEDLSRGGHPDDVIDDISNVILTLDQSSAKLKSIGDTIGKTIDVIVERSRSGRGMVGIPSGFDDLDRYTSGLAAGHLLIIAGRPSMGKSTLALNIAHNIAKGGRNAAFFSLEMPRLELEQKIISRAYSVDYENLRNGTITEDELKIIGNAKIYAKGVPLHIRDTSGLMIAQVSAECRALHMRKNLDLIVVDYIGLMKGQGQNREQEIASISRGFKKLAMDLQIPVIVLSQLNRAVEQRVDKRPQLSDLRESGAIEQDADIVILIYRDEWYNQSFDNPEKGIAELIIAKNRAGRTGKVTVSSSRLAYSEFSPLSNYQEDRI